MPVPGSGELQWSDFQTEFGGSYPITLAEYYGKDTLPGSGEIKASDFYGTSDVTFTVATGGTITTDGNYKVHTFTATGTFEITTIGSNATVVYLIVAGGGGAGYGSSGYYSGGGGGGADVAAGTSGSLSVTTYAVAIGVGGYTGWYPGDGGGSSFNGVSTTGGNNGGTYHWAPGGGNNGGGGGGSAYAGGAGGTGSYAGGTGRYLYPLNQEPHHVSASGGGGTVTEVGVNAYLVTSSAYNRVAGAGGDGQVDSITGSSVTYGGGGGGGMSYAHNGSNHFRGEGGAGGGGAGHNGAGNAGTANTGGGGGGGSNGNAGGVGGSGVVIIRYLYQ